MITLPKELGDLLMQMVSDEGGEAEPELILIERIHTILDYSRIHLGKYPESVEVSAGMLSLYAIASTLELQRLVTQLRNDLVKLRMDLHNGNLGGEPS